MTESDQTAAFPVESTPVAAVPAAAAAAAAPAAAAPTTAASAATPAATAAPTPAAPGWYADKATGLQRWWDGSSWTDKWAPGEASPRPQLTLDPPRDALVAYLLLIFVGFIGAHRFYVRRKVTGFIMLGLWAGGWLAGFAGVPLVTVVVAHAWQFVDLFILPFLIRRANAERATKYW